MMTVGRGWNELVTDGKGRTTGENDHWRLNADAAA